MTDPKRAGAAIGSESTIVMGEVKVGFAPTSHDASQSTAGGSPASKERTTPLELDIGSLFAGRYTVETMLGRGGMGVVYRAQDRLVDERVALKLLDIGQQLPEDAVEMFRREVRVARRVTHPHVVRIHDLAEHRELLYITMQYVEGSDVRREMERRAGKLDPARAARIACEIAQALAAAHEMGVVHRDLKPENVLVDGDGRAVLSDFGIARFFDNSFAEKRATRVIGTPAYMAPEQVAGQEVGPPADIYALGVVLFEMLAGRPPFVGDNPIALAVARLHEDAPDIRTLTQVPEHLATLVADCLQRQPEKRPDSAATLAADLEEFLEGVGPAAGTIAAARRPNSIRSESKTARARSRALAMPFATGRAALACLPFTYRGPAEHDYLSDAVSGELIDVLSRTKGLRVLSSGAVAHIAERDPRKLTQDLDVDYLVDGTIQVAGPKLRIAVRLVDASGSQLFSDRFDLGFGDLFDMQDEAGRRIAEALRLEVVTRHVDVTVPPEAMQAFLQARRILRAQKFLEAPQAVALLEKTLELCPGFHPARASLAIATIFVWFYPQGDRSRDWEAAADAAVQNALVSAPDLVETHVGAARIASHRGKLREAVVALRRAIDIAPTSPDAHHILGQLECETGRAEEGLARLAVAHQLEPSGVYPYEAARLAALRGDHASFDKLMVAVKRLQAPLACLHLELRHASWWGDATRLESILAECPALGAPFDQVIATVTRCFLGEGDPHQAVAALSSIMPHVNARFGALFRQILVEVHCHAKDLDGALEWLAEAQSTILYDLPWLEFCPLLEPLRELPDFDAVQREVRTRCTAVWAA